MLVALLSLMTAAAIDLSANAAAGVVGALPGAGLELELRRGADDFLQVRGDVGVFARTRAYDTPFNAYYPLVMPGSVEGALVIPMGARSRVGAALALDWMAVAAAEQSCDNGCRFEKFIGGDAGVGVARAVAYGGRWIRPGERLSLDLGFGFQPTRRYDVAMFAPRLDLNVSAASGWGIGVEMDRFALALEVNRTLSLPGRPAE